MTLTRVKKENTAEPGRSRHSFSEWVREVRENYLLKEFNIWRKAKYYSENNKSDFSSLEFKQAYYYLILINFEIVSETLFENKDFYLRDFNLNDIIYRELCEDIIYILLNLLLADKIVGNEALENSLDNNEKIFFRF